MENLAVVCGCETKVFNCENFQFDYGNTVDVIRHRYRNPAMFQEDNHSTPLGNALPEDFVNNRPRTDSYNRGSI